LPIQPQKITAYLSRLTSMNHDMKCDQEGKEDSVSGVPYTLTLRESHTDYEHIVDLSSIPYGVVGLTGIGMKEWLGMDPNKTD